MTGAPKPLLLAILRQLNAHSFISGEDLAEQFGISRASVSLTLQQAKPLGVEIQRIHGKGYRLAHEIDWLVADDILQHCANYQGQLQVLPIIDSTNTWLLQHPQTARHATCVIAECQTGGRGRRGRQWTSALGGSLTFSLRWDFPFGIARLSGLSLATGIAIVRALRRLGLSQAQLKWPNDVLIDQHKLAGMLIETQGDALGPIETIIGIGLNIRLPSEQRTQIDQGITDLSEHFQTPLSRNLLMAILLDELTEVLGTFSSHGFAAFREEWMAYHAWQGEHVNILQQQQCVLSGIVEGISEEGALLIHTENGLETIHAGDVSLRRRQ